MLTDNSVTSADVQLSTLQGADVAANTLTGADIDESSLSLPPTTTATFAGPANPSLERTQLQEGRRQDPAGGELCDHRDGEHASDTVVAEASGDTVCELRNGSGYIGGATDRRGIAGRRHTSVSLSMNGGAQVPAGGGEVSLW